MKIRRVDSLRTVEGLEVRAIQERAELDRATELMKETYVYGDPLVARYREWPLDQHRIVIENGQHQGGLVFEPLAQFFGGQSLSCACTFGVVVAAEARGRGLGSALFRETFADWRASGVLMSTLYPSDTFTYRRFGYEVGGSYLVYRLPVNGIRSKGQLPVEPWDDSNLGEVEDFYQANAKHCNGALDRSERWWRLRIFNEFADVPFHRYLVRRNGRVVGYLVYSQSQVQSALQIFWDLNCVDFHWEDAEAANSLLSFIAAHRPIVRDFIWPGPPDDPIFQLCQQNLARVDFYFNWMSRLIDVRAALAARGYPVDVDAGIDLLVRDPLVPENNGGLRLEVAGGSATVSESKTARTEVDIGALSSIFTGWLSPRRAMQGGRLTVANDAQLSTLERIFAGSIPWLIEEF